MKSEKYQQAQRKANPTIEGIDQLVAAIKNGKTLATEQRRLRDPRWKNKGLFEYMKNMGTTPPQTQKQAGLLDPNALKFIALLSVVGFIAYKLIERQDTPEPPKSNVNHSKSVK